VLSNQQSHKFYRYFKYNSKFCSFISSLLKYDQGVDSSNTY